MCPVLLPNMNAYSEKPLGDSPQHLSDDEKNIGGGHQRDVLPPDPDEHLSAEERARIVSQTKHDGSRNQY